MAYSILVIDEVHNILVRDGAKDYEATAAAIRLARAGKPLVRLHYYASHPQTKYGDGRASSDMVGDAREALLLRDPRQFREQLVLAEVTAVCRVRGVIRIGEFPRLDDAHGKVKLPRDGQRFLQLAPRQTRGVGNHRQRSAAQDLLRQARQKNRIHPARVSDEAGTVRAQQRAQLRRMGAINPDAKKEYDSE